MKFKIYLLAVLTICCLEGMCQNDTEINLDTNYRISEIIRSTSLTSGFQIFKIDNTKQLRLEISKVDYLALVGKLMLPGPPQVSEDKPYRSFEILTDQDRFIDKLNEDRDYTMGILFKWTNDKHDIAAFPRKFIDRGLEKFCCTDFRGSATMYTFRFGFSGFTPFHIEYRQVDSTDRPYASLMYVTSESIKHHPLPGGKKVNISFGIKSAFTLGSIGQTSASVAQFVQTGIHSGQRSFKAPGEPSREDPLGWKNAIGYNNSIKLPIAFDYNREIFWVFERRLAAFNRVILKKRIPDFTASVMPSVSTSLGTLYDNFQASAQGQIGIFDRNSFLGFFNADNGRIFDRNDRHQFELSLVAGVAGQFWLYNATLQGNMFARSQDAYHLQYRNIRKWTGNYNYGIQIRLKNTVVGYSKYFRSEETFITNRIHAFGRAYLKVNF